MVIETDLHLNSRHPDYNQVSVQRLIQPAQAYLMEHGHNGVIRLVSTRSGDIWADPPRQVMLEVRSSMAFKPCRAWSFVGAPELGLPSRVGVVSGPERLVANS